MIPRIPQTVLSSIFIVITVFLVSCLSSTGVVRKSHDVVLQKNLESLVVGSKGDVGVYVRNLKTGQTASIQPDTLFPTASMIKVPIMCALSDNTASLWLQELAGAGTTINEWLERNGFHQTRVNSRTPGTQSGKSMAGDIPPRERWQNWLP
jgi:beta-lactamase class A